MAKKESAKTKERKALEKKRKSTPLGEGGRFKAVEAAAAKGGASNPAAVAAAIGRKKYGAEKMAKMAAAGKKKG